MDVLLVSLCSQALIQYTSSMTVRDDVSLLYQKVFTLLLCPSSTDSIQVVLSARVIVVNNAIVS